MSGVLDRLIARVAGDASGEPGLRAPAQPAAVAAGEDSDWAGEVVEEHLVEDRPVQARRAISADVDEHGPTPARASPSAQVAVSQQPAMLRQTPELQSPAFLATGGEPSGRGEDHPIKPLKPASLGETPIQGLNGPKVEATVAMRPVPAAPTFPSAPIQGEGEPSQSQQAGSSTPSRPNPASADPDSGEDESETLIIEIGRIELVPPMQPGAGPAPMRRERTVTLSSYLADRRAGRR
ncbi:hypothetical protein PX699_22265 [Sphingobium sp. H39-3-25]|uniref:hypothetical protein n=1 Tax=Sphingobium arseniciresistens TaxID=3030834 RepID=UPI0023B92AE2|nr:hypothetical protein [Sphingobium arseniciresistens]